MYENHGRNVILQNFLKTNKFSSDSYEIIDRICKLTDGGGADKYTLNQFLQLLNQQFFYKLYQPKLPNDKGLFKIWRNFLESRGVEFYLDTNIENIKINKDKIDSISVYKDNSFHTIKSDKYVFAIPPKNLVDIVDKFKIKHDWGNIHDFANETAYIDYISVSFHWNKKLELKKVYGFPKSSWGIAFVVLNDYMKFDEDDSKTVISTAITISDRKSPNNNKTANECNAEELIKEIYLQLKESFGDLPIPTKVLFSPGVEYEYKNKKWISKDTAYIMTSNKGYLPFKNNLVTNMYNLGTHNGKSLYKFTSLESAVSNSVALSKELYSINHINVSKTTSISDVFRMFIMVIIIYLIYNVITRYGKRKR
jgi:hypothetical protein